MVEVITLHEMFPCSAKLPKMGSSAILSIQEKRKDSVIGVCNRFVFFLNEIQVSDKHDLHKSFL